MMAAVLSTRGSRTASADTGLAHQFRYKVCVTSYYGRGIAAGLMDKDRPESIKAAIRIDHGSNPRKACSSQNYHSFFDGVVRNAFIAPWLKAAGPYFSSIR